MIAASIGFVIVFAILNIPYVKRIVGELIDNLFENQP